MKNARRGVAVAFRSILVLAGFPPYASAMRLVKVFESGGDAVLGLPYGFCFGQVALRLLRYQFRHIAHSEK